MKTLLHELVREVSEIIPASTRVGELGTAKEYADLLSRILAGFHHILTNDGQSMTREEKIRVARQLDADWETLLADWVKAGGKADVFEQIFGTALVSGAVEGAKARQTEPVKNRIRARKVTRVRAKTRTTP